MNDFETHWKSLKWKEIESNKIKVFQLDEEPIIFYLIRIRDNEYMAIHEDGYDLNTGKVEFLSEQEVREKYKVDF